MGSILAGLLGPALTTATQAVGGYEQGKAKAAQSELEAALQRAQLQRQQQDFDLKQQIEARQAHSSALQDAMTQYKLNHPTIDPLSPQGIQAKTQLQHDAIDYGRTNGYHPAPPSDVQFLVSQDAQGNPVYAVGDKRARTVTPTNAPAKPTPGGTGHGLGALSPAAIQGMYAQAEQADKVMRDFEAKYAQDPGSLGTLAQGLGAGAYQHQNGLLSGLSAAASNAGLNLVNKDYQTYLAAQKRFGNIMGNLMSRRYSEYQGALDTQLAGLSASDAANTIALKQSYRDDLLKNRPGETENAPPPGNPAPTGSNGGNPLQAAWDAAAAELRAQGKDTSILGPRP